LKINHFVYGEVSNQRNLFNRFAVQIERLKKLLLERLDLSPQFRMLKTVTDIGPILSMIIALEVGDIGRFAGVGG
jgi:transposase